MIREPFTFWVLSFVPKTYGNLKIEREESKLVMIWCRLCVRLGQNKQRMEVVHQARVLSSLDLLVCESNHPRLLLARGPHTDVQWPGSGTKGISSGLVWLLFSLLCLLVVFGSSLSFFVELSLLVFVSAVKLGFFLLTFSKIYSNLSELDRLETSDSVNWILLWNKVASPGM